jgi:hypothetical protein
MSNKPSQPPLAAVLVQQNAPNDNPDANDGRYGDRRSPGLGHLVVITCTGGRCAKQHQPKRSNLRIDNTTHTQS